MLNRELAISFHEVGLIGELERVYWVTMQINRLNQKIKIRTRHEKTANAAVIVEKDPSAARVELGKFKIVRSFQ